MTTIELLLAAMMMVESGGDVSAVGDGGASLGALQISRAYWVDAVGQLRREGVDVSLRDYECDVRDVKVAKGIVKAYWRRWCVVALNDLDLQTLARVHNGGGPHGATRRCTVKYWVKVQAAMRELTTDGHR